MPQAIWPVIIFYAGKLAEKPTSGGSVFSALWHCKSCTIDQLIKLKRKRNAPEPLRDDNNPNGLRNLSLSLVNKMKISQASQAVSFDSSDRQICRQAHHDRLRGKSAVFIVLGHHLLGQCCQAAQVHHFS